MLKEKAQKRFEALGMPRPKRERFHYPRLNRSIFPTGQVEGEVFQWENPPFSIYSFREAMQRYGIFFQQRFDRWIQKEQDPFVCLNLKLEKQAMVGYVPAGQCIDQIVRIKQVFSSEESAPRLHLMVGRGARVSLDLSSDMKAEVYNGVIDLFLDEGAHCTLYQEIPEGKSVMSALRANLKSKAKLEVIAKAKGSDFSRSSYEVALEGAESEVCLKGLTELVENKEHHVEVFVEHKEESCLSSQLFKTMVSDEGIASFEGKIYVHSKAQKTNAYQLNSNLILSDEAKAFSKPGLEIFADDVKASHGSTFTNLDEESCFYLRSRGLCLAEAQRLLIEGFRKEILDLFPEKV